MGEYTECEIESSRGNANLREGALQAFKNFGQKALRHEWTSQWTITLANQAVYSLSGFFVNIMLGRFCGKTELGLYTLGQTIGFMIMSVQNTLILTPYAVFLPRITDRDSAKCYSGNVLLSQLVLTILVVLGLVGANFLFRGWKSSEGLAPVMHALTLTIVFVLLREYIRRISFAELKLKRALIIDCSVSGLQMLGIAILWKYNLLSARNAYYSLLIACGIPSIVWLVLTRRSIRFDFSSTLRDIKMNWSLGKWVSFGAIGVQSAMQCYPWFLNFFHGIQFVGAFTACDNIVNMANPFIMAGRNLFLPKFGRTAVHDGPLAMRRSVIQITLFVVVSMAVFCVGIALFGEKILQAVYGKRFIGEGALLLLLAVAALIANVGSASDYALTAMKRTDLNFVLYMANLLCVATAGLALIKVYGLHGVAFARILVSSIVSILAVLLLTWATQKRQRRYRSRNCRRKADD